MSPKKKKRRLKKKTNRKRRHIILILLLVCAGVFIFFEEFGREKKPLQRPVPQPEEREVLIFPERPAEKALPKVAIVIDDLGPNRKMAAWVLNIKSPLTLSIMPRRPYTVWIAEEGHRRGRDIIAHIPMEATKPLKLGEGGLYTGMSDSEIIRVLEQDLGSVPHIKGCSNHMGSAFTQNERAMKTVMRTLGKHGLFFLDSLTTPETAAFRVARAEGLTALKRDVFLDDSNDPDDIAAQWKRLVKIARKTGSAIALGHPRKNTLGFLEKTLTNNDDITVVPITELIAD